MDLRRFIKNTTPYLGKITLEFDKHPHYSGRTVLNKVHLDLGFTKLSSRVVPEIPDPEKVELIYLYTNGEIKDHEWEDPMGNKYVLENSFLSKTGEYIGSLKDGWWYYENGLIVCDGCPRGVAQKNVVGENSVSVKYHGYTHRGGSLFGVGDRLFDEKYVPKEEDYEPWQWAGWRERFLKDALKARRKKDDFWYKWLKEDGIAAYIPFALRGPKVIQTIEEAKQAASNLSKYLS
jgi:hypothetical protein